MQDYQSFLKKFRIKNFKKGEVILCQGEVPASAYVVKSGVVKTYNLTRSGEEKPIGFVMDNEVFPLVWVFGKVHKSQYYYEAVGTSEIYCVPPGEYMQFVEKNPHSLMHLFHRIVESSMGFQLRINALEQSKALSKVVNTLHFLALRFGEDVRRNTIRLKIQLTQQDIANMTGLTRETTGMELKKLVKQGILDCHKRHYLVRTDKLNPLLDEDYGLGIEGKRPEIKA